MADEIAPITPTEGNSRPFRVKPQTRFEMLLKTNSFIAELRAKSQVMANRRHQGSQTFTTVDGLPRLIIEELVYPGNATEPPLNKWIYLIHSGRNQIMAEVHASSILGMTTGWMWRDWPPIDEPDEKRDMNGWGNRNTFALGEMGIPLTSLAPGEDPSVIRAFLSPYQLDRRGMELLLSAQSPYASGAGSEAQVAPVWAHPKPGYVALVDPFRWATEAHKAYYLPRLDELQEYALGEDAQARLTIAGTIKAWMANGDPADVGDELARTPDDFFEEFKREEARLRRLAEDAGAYVGHCVDCIEHYVVEQSLLDRGTWETQVHDEWMKLGVDLGRSFALQHFAAVTDRLSQTATGAELIVALLASPDRTITRLLLPTGPRNALLNGDYFAAGRWVSLAATGVLREFLPAYVVRLYKAKNPELTVEAKIREVLKNLNVEVYPHDRDKIYKALAAADPSAVSKDTRRKMRRLVIAYDKSNPPAARAAEITKTADKLEHSAKFQLGRALYPIQVAVEIYNVVNAIATNSEEQTTRSFASAVGASVDLAAMLLELSVTLFKIERQWGSLAKAGGGVLSVASGALDLYDNAMKASDSYASRDYGQMAGQTIAAVGAGTVVVGGAMSFWGGVLLLMAGTAEGAEIGACGGPIPAVIGAAGGLVLATGTVAAALLKLNIYETFAARSFLGLHHDDMKPGDVLWSPVPLPQRNARDELKALVALLSNYRIGITGSGGPDMGDTDQNGVAVAGTPFNYLEIRPGNSDPKEVMELRIDYSYGPHQKWFCVYHLRFNEPRPVKVAGTATLRESDWQIVRRSPDDPSPTLFRVPIQPWTLQVGDRTVFYRQRPGGASCGACKVTTRLLSIADGGSSAFQTPVKKKVVLNGMKMTETSSTDPDSLP